MSYTGAMMGSEGESLFEAFLNQHDDAAWRGVVQKLQPTIHEVDRAATVIWFYFYPLALRDALQQAQDPQALAKKLLLQGRYELKDQIDTSHRFLYGHRYWPQVKAAVSEYAATSAPASLDLAAQIREVAAKVARASKAPEPPLVGITAVAFMTLQQVGAVAFKAAPGAIQPLPNRSPEQVLRDRARDDRQGLFGFLKPDKQFTVSFDENDSEAKFSLINTQHLTTAAASDPRGIRVHA